MKISDKKLARVYFQDKFDTMYELTEDRPIILNNLEVYTVVNDWVHSKVDFDIFTLDGKKYISPRYNPSRCDGFLLIGERLVMGKTIEIKAEDYACVDNIDGNFTFLMESEVR